MIPQKTQTQKQVLSMTIETEKDKLPVEATAIWLDLPAAGQLFHALHFHCLLLFGVKSQAPSEELS